MSRARVAALSLALVACGLTGCARSYCSDPENQFEAMCQLLDGGSAVAFTVTPSRIEINKDAKTSIAISAYTNFANKLITLTQAGGTAKPFPIGNIGSDGTLNATLKANELTAQGFVPGSATLELAGQKQPVRIFVSPKFDSVTFSAAHDVSYDHGATNIATPSWVGISSNGSKKILTLNEYSIATIGKQAIGEYSYDSSNKTLGKAAPSMFSAYNATPYMDTAVHSIALSMSDFIIPEFGNTSISLITKCSLDGTCAGSTAVKYGTISSLSAAANGQLYAGIFDTKMLIFSDSELSAKLSINGTAASMMAPYFVVVYNANEDAHADVSIWHSDGNVSIAISDSSGKNLNYAAEASASIKSSGMFGNAPPDAVAASDIDQDGLDDFVIAKGRALYVLFNLGGGRFSASAAISIPSQGPAGSVMVTPVSAIAIGDLSADGLGHKDLILASKTNRLIAVMENSATLR